MASYTFSLDQYEIKDTRSRHEDTNYVTATLSVGNQPIGAPQVKFMGNQNNGTYRVGFVWPNVEVDVHANQKVTLLYSIMNLGHKDRPQVEQALVAAAQKQLGNTPTADWKQELLKFAAETGLKWLFANCDGPITPPGGRKIEMAGFGLADTPPGSSAVHKQNEPGNDSPTGCGGNSHYVVQYTVAAH